jgi:hypothetical protein
MERRVIQLRTHRKNIDRYQGLLKTKLNETERLFLKKRVCEETLAMLRLMEHELKQSSMSSRLHRPQAGCQ